MKNNGIMRNKQSILFTGANGLIGKEVYKYFEEKYSTLFDLHRIDKSVNLDLCDSDAVNHWMLKWRPDYIVHLASLTDVAESIILPEMYIRNNTIMTLNLMEAVRKYNPTCRVLLFNTDEVFDYKVGEFVKEDSPINSRNPYSASKLCQKAIGMAYKNTYNLDIVITHMTNCYGPNQSQVKHIGGSMKLIPALFEAAVNDTPFRMDDNGSAKRTWVCVYDTATAIETALFNGTDLCYNIAGDEILSVKEIYDIVCEITGKKIKVENTTRQGQDPWYALDCSKLKHLGWKPVHTVKEELKKLWEEKVW